MQTRANRTGTGSRLLLVDADTAQRRALARAVASHRRDITLLSAGSAREAMAVLAKTPVDSALCDLRLPDIDGFQLVAWMLEHTPRVAAFAMTERWDQQAEDRFTRLGGIECFAKPLEMAAVLRRIDEVLAGDFRGHIRNMSAASLLQIIHMERKTCTLSLASASESGKIYVQDGEIVHARTDTLSGEQAALAILAWPDPTISIGSRCKVSERSIDRPITHLVMEAMRLADESARTVDAEPHASEPPPSLRPSLSPPPSAKLESTLLTVGSSALPNAAAAAVSRFPLATLKVLGVALVHVEGHVMARSDDGGVELSAMALVARNVLAELRRAQVHLASGQRVEEVVLNVAGLCYVIKPLASRDAFVLLVFNPRDTSLAIRRADLEVLAKTIEQSWDAPQSGAPRRSRSPTPAAGHRASASEHV